MKKTVLFIALTLLISNILFAQVPSIERNELITLYDNMGGVNWVDNTNWDTANPVSTWFGITTTVINGQEHVTGIDLTSNGLTGSAADAVWLNFEEVTTLKLANNQIENKVDLTYNENLQVLQFNGNLIDQLVIGSDVISVSNGNFNIKNNPNLSCVQVNNGMLSTFDDLSLDYIDLGTIISNTSCDSVNDLAQAEKEALNALYTDTGSWSDSTYKITDPARNTVSKGFTYIDISGVRHVQTIDLSQNNLHGDIAASFGNLTQLTELRLNNNSISSLPEELSNLTQLEILYLNNNSYITTLPTNIGNWTSLTELYIQECNINVLPTSIYNLSSIQKLNFANNGITLLPEEIGNLTTLTELIASPNPFPSVPTQMSNLINLSVLDLSGSLITNIPTGFSGLTNMTELYLHNNDLQIIFENGIGNLTQLTKLTLADNRLTSLPNDIGNLTSLTELTLENNLLESLPAGIGNLTLLNELNLTYSALTSLPVEIGNLTNLTSLNFYANHITNLPAEIGNLTNLEYLELYGNELETLPTEIGNLTSLEYLKLTSNKLNTLPTSIGNLSSLTTLLIDYQYDNTTNQYTLTTMPSSISNLTALTEINLGQNEITSTLDLSNMSNLTSIYLEGNQISGLALGIAPTSLFYVADNPYLNCIEVPTAYLTDWQNSGFATSTSNVDNGVVFSDSCGANNVPQAEREALIAIHNAFYTTGIWQNWDLDPNSTSNVGSWVGVTTAQIGGVKHVTELNFTSSHSGVVAAIPSEIGNLTQLVQVAFGSAYSNDVRVNELPTEIGNLTNLVSLSLPYHSLTSLPDEIGNLSSLETLSIGGGLISSLPNTIGNLSSLKSFYVAGSTLESLPSTIGNLSNLEQLYLGSNRISSLPIEIGNLSSLTHLEAQNQYDGATNTYVLTNIPDELNNLSSLTYLDLSNNNIAGSLDFSALDQLTYLLLNSNAFNEVKVGAPDTNFTSWHFNLSDNPNLGCIEVPTAYVTGYQNHFDGTQYVDNGVIFSDDCSNAFIPQAERDALIAIYNALANGTGWTNWSTDPNSTTNVGAWAGVTTAIVDGVKHVTELSIPNMTVSTAFPTALGELTELLKLSITDNNTSITSLPAEISALSKLTEITLYYQYQLTSLPDEIGNLTNLISLAIYESVITNLPTSIGNLSNLESLQITHNALTNIPTEIGNLTNLRNLYLSNNALTSLPSSIGNLIALESLAIEHNQLSSLPSEINNLTALNQIYVSYNEITGDLIWDNLINLYYLDLKDNMISGIKLTGSPFNLDIRYNPYITCIEVPTSTLNAWQNSYDIDHDNGVIFSDACSGNYVPDAERLALIAFYNATSGGDTWTGENWNTDPNDLTNVGAWEGVTTEMIDGQKHVVTLEINGHNLTGIVPPEIGDLSQLKILRIYKTYQDDNLTSLPEELGNLINLTELSVNQQGLTTLPTSIGNLDNLLVLDVSNNRLSSLPIEIGELASVKTMYLNNNFLTEIPTEIGSNPVLERLYIEYNQLTTLPAGIGNFQNLKGLYAAYNMLTSIPIEINDIVTLENLNLDHNQIEGCLNLDNLTSLGYLWLYSNDISCLKLNVSPTSFGSSIWDSFRVTQNDLGCIEVPTAELVSWQLSEAGLDEGVIFSDNCSQEHPTPQTEIDALTAFYTATNGDSWTSNTNWLSSEPISEWEGVTVNGFHKVKKIELPANNLTGTLPTSWSDLPELQTLALSSNVITGTIPTALGSLENFKKLDLTANSFNGAIPAELGITSLKYLLLANNSFSGVIPSELSNAYYLKELHLQDNNLEGDIPSSLSYIYYLESLRLNNNELTGVIPSVGNEFLKYLVVNNNNLSGNIPYLSDSPLVEVNISQNYFIFSNIEPYFDYINTTADTFIYAPMAEYDEETEIIFSDGDTVTLTALFEDTATSKIASSANNIYQWFKDGQEIGGATENIYSISSANYLDVGTYQCRVTNSVVTGLTIWSNPYVLTGNSLSLVTELNSTFSIYPNPANDEIHILQKDDITINKINVYDSRGRLILGTTSKLIDVHNLEAGIYMVKVMDTKGKSTSKKLIIK